MNLSANKINVNSNVEEMPGIGTYRRKVFSKLSIKTLYDALYFFPKRYEDRRQVRKINELSDEEGVCVIGKLLYPISSKFVKSGMTVQNGVLLDETGHLKMSWFNSVFLCNQLISGQEYAVYGKVSYHLNEPCMVSPIIELVNISEKTRHTRRIMPIYPLSNGVSQKSVQNLIAQSVDSFDTITEYIPKWILKENNLCNINLALKSIHFPEDFEKLDEARRRLIFEEFFFLQLGLQKAKLDENIIESIPLKNINGLESFIKSLPFKLTDSQKRISKQVILDMSKNTPMNRLIQGDVGCGKTMIAIIAMFIATSSGASCAFMAPTEILSMQHYKNIERIFSRYNIDVNLLTGNTKSKDRKRMLNNLDNGKSQIIIGTHAITSDSVIFGNLELVITDEQHRFGVRQRANLVKKGRAPHVLVMSATPIPRSLGLVMYGDLEISIIDSYPTGRKEIKTYIVDESIRTRIHKFISSEVQKGRQIYIVCPLVENEQIDEQDQDNEEISDKKVSKINNKEINKKCKKSVSLKNLKSVIQYAQNLRENIFTNFNIGLVHGKLSKNEKEIIMSRFVAGEIDILVATTVIEVGVDVSNASLMIIENAERFGLSQLHQLRGRVGRGQYQSYCVMFCESRNSTTLERLKMMAKTNNGFQIAEKDLEIRGPGDFFGHKQHGLPQIKTKNMGINIEIIKNAKEMAQQLLKLEMSPELIDKLQKHVSNSDLLTTL